MSGQVYKTITVYGTSDQSFDDAVRNAIVKAAETVHGMRWFEVVETRGHVEDGKLDLWQVGVKIGFKLD